MSSKGQLVRIKSDKMPRSILISREVHHQIYPERPPRMFFVTFERRSSCTNVTEEVAKWLIRHHKGISIVERFATSETGEYPITPYDTPKARFDVEDVTPQEAPPPKPVEFEDPRALAGIEGKFVKDENWRELPYIELLAYARKLGIEKTFGMKKRHLVKLLEEKHDDQTADSQ